jgi:glycosyltransferase involved in cell wall biosynthesis
MKFSIVTPSFRNSEWLKLCVASVADQGVAHEHIVQDAGSDDGTLDWLPHDPRVTACVEKDAGMYDGINRGWRKARGEIIAHLNCDEQYLPGALAAVAEYFAQHPETDVLFADAVITDGDGAYLWHRKMLVPRAWHTATCPLSTLTCATFFRRRVLDERGLFYDPAWKFVGDSDWVLRLIRAGLRLAVLRRFTSVFTHTGANLSLKAQDEAEKFHRRTPMPLRALRPAILVHHRLRRWAGGIYAQEPFDFSLYTRAQPEQRVTRHVAHPTSRWRW